MSKTKLLTLIGDVALGALAVIGGRTIVYIVKNRKEIGNAIRLRKELNKMYK